MIATCTGIGNPLDLTVEEFDRLLALSHERPDGGPDPRPWHRRYVEESLS